MDSVNDQAFAETPDAEAPDAETYLGLTEEEKDVELQKSIIRMHNLICKISYSDTGRDVSDKK